MKKFLDIVIVLKKIIYIFIMPADRTETWTK